MVVPFSSLVKTPGGGGSAEEGPHRGRGRDFPGASVVKNPPANSGDSGLIPGPGRCPGEENDNLLQYACLGNLMGRGTWWVTVRGTAKE